MLVNSTYIFSYIKFGSFDSFLVSHSRSRFSSWLLFKHFPFTNFVFFSLVTPYRAWLQKLAGKLEWSIFSTFFSHCRHISIGYLKKYFHLINLHIWNRMNKVRYFFIANNKKKPNRKFAIIHRCFFFSQCCPTFDSIWTGKNKSPNPVLASENFNKCKPEVGQEIG